MVKSDSNIPLNILPTEPLKTKASMMGKKKKAKRNAYPATINAICWESISSVSLIFDFIFGRNSFINRPTMLKAIPEKNSQTTGVTSRKKIILIRIKPIRGISKPKKSFIRFAGSLFNFVKYPNAVATNGVSMKAYIITRTFVGNTPPNERTTVRLGFGSKEELKMLSEIMTIKKK